MAKKVALLVDTNIFIDFYNHNLFKEFFQSSQFQIYYSLVTKKELLSKEGLSDKERQSIQRHLKKLRMILLEDQILKKYSELRKNYPSADKEDSLIAASAIVKNIPLLTQNLKHFRVFEELEIYSY